MTPKTSKNGTTPKITEMADNFASLTLLPSQADLPVLIGIGLGAAALMGGALGFAVGKTALRKNAPSADPLKLVRELLDQLTKNGERSTVQFEKVEEPTSHKTCWTGSIRKDGHKFLVPDQDDPTTAIRFSPKDVVGLTITPNTGAAVVAGIPDVIITIRAPKMEADTGGMPANV